MATEHSDPEVTQVNLATEYAALRKSAELALMYLESGFIECTQCGHEVKTAHTDAAYELERALARAALTKEFP